MSALEKSDVGTLEAKSFQIVFLSHARAMLSVDFSDVLSQLCSVLDELTIPIEVHRHFDAYHCHGR
jgi:hypothetical protein